MNHLRILSILLALGCDATPEPAPQEPVTDTVDDAPVPPAACVSDGPERCDRIDNDCNGLIDDDAGDAVLWFFDADGDGRGAELDAFLACEQPEFYVLAPGDCDDFDAHAFPGAVETCDGVDENCLDGVDENLTWFTIFADADADGFGTDEPVGTACAPSFGYADAAGDCDDTDPAFHPAAQETCDGVDEDCDGDVDDGLADRRVVGPDFDGDGYVNLDAAHLACVPRSFEAYATPMHDCDDLEPAVHAGATEVCDGGVDNDCDGNADDRDLDIRLLDPAITGQQDWWYDSDRDGFGSGSYAPMRTCVRPASWYATQPGDCNDYNAAATNIARWKDADGDGRGDPNAPLGCNGGVANDDDCDDTDATKYEGALRYRDRDGDGYGDEVVRGLGCDTTTVHAVRGADCDDADPTRHPAAVDACDGVDQNCSGNENDAIDRFAYYADEDEDGDGTGSPFYGCALPKARSLNRDDCDDTDPALNQRTPWFADVDGDGEASPDAEVVAIGCGPFEGVSRLIDDCDDSDPEVYGLRGWYLDEDGDGTGSTRVEAQGCVNPDPARLLGKTGDCDDLDPTSPTWCGPDRVPTIMYMSYSGSSATLTCGDETYTISNTMATYLLPTGVNCVLTQGTPGYFYNYMNRSACVGAVSYYMYNGSRSEFTPTLCDACTDPDAENYTRNAPFDDGSCLYGTYAELPADATNATDLEGSP